jgi:hypothetical protein
VDSGEVANPINGPTRPIPKASRMEVNRNRNIKRGRPFFLSARTYRNLGRYRIIGLSAVVLQRMRNKIGIKLLIVLKVIQNISSLIRELKG